MNINQLYKELKRRNVFRVATAYSIAGWVIIQIADTVFPRLGLPDWTITFIIALVSIGLPIALIISWAFEITEDGIKKSNEVDIKESVTAETGKKLNGLIIGALSIAVFFLVIERVFFAKATILDNIEDSITAEVQNASIAVLPFVNMSSDEENEYFSDGLSEELLNALAKVEDMKVAGRTSSFKFKGQNENLTEIGKELGVHHILEGSVRKSGNRVRITAQLIKVDDGYHMWSETYDRELEDIFEVQEEISRKVLNELRIRLLEEDENELTSIPTRDVEAYQMFLKANQLLAGRDIDDINVAIDLYQNALKLDPGFSQAYAKLAIAYNLQGYYGNIPFENVQKNVLDYAETALSMDENSANAYAALGLYYGNASELERSRDAYLKSIELNPNNADVYNWLAIAYDDLGMPDKRNEAYKKMYEVDPLAPISIYNRALVHNYERDHEKAVDVLNKNIQQNPGFALSYTGLAIFKGNSPFGQMDESFKNARKAMKYGRDARAMVWLVIRAIDLDIKPVADFYFERLRTDFSQSFEYISIIPYYSLYIADYKYLEEDAFAYQDETNTVNQNAPYYIILSEYLKHSGNEERVLSEFQKYVPSLFADTLEPLTIRNYARAFDLVNIYDQLGNQQQVNKLLTAYCASADELKGEFADGEDSYEYLEIKMNCHLFKNEYSQALPYVESIFIEQRRRVAAWYVFEERISDEAYETEGYTEIREAVMQDLQKQRENVIAYLKAEGEWREEWEQ